MWFVLSTRLKSANEQVMTTSTHIDEQVQSLANQVSSTYAPITTVEDIARDLHDINKTLNNKTENLKNSLTFTNEETKQQYMKNLAEVNQFSQDYATKAMAVKSDFEKRLMDVEDNTQTWQQTQNQLYSDFVKKQNELLKKNQAVADKVFQAEQELLKDSREIKQTMHTVADRTSLINDFTIKTRDDMNKRINKYTRDLNNLYNTNLNTVSDTMSKNDFLVKTNVNKLNIDLRRDQARIDKTNAIMQNEQAMHAKAFVQHKRLIDKHQKTADNVLQTEKTVIKESMEAKAAMLNLLDETNKLRNFTLKTKESLEDSIKTSTKTAQNFTLATKVALENNIMTTKGALDNNILTTKVALDNTMTATKAALENNIQTTNSKTNATMQSEISRVIANIKKNDDEMRALQTANIALFKGLIAQQSALIENMKQTTEGQFKANDTAIKAKINEIIQTQTNNYTTLSGLIQNQANNYNTLLKSLQDLQRYTYDNVKSLTTTTSSNTTGLQNQLNALNDLRTKANKRLDDHDVALQQIRSSITGIIDTMNKNKDFLKGLETSTNDRFKKVTDAQNKTQYQLDTTSNMVQYIKDLAIGLKDKASFLESNINSERIRLTNVFNALNAKIQTVENKVDTIIASYIV